MNIWGHKNIEAIVNVDEAAGFFPVLCCGFMPFNYELTESPQNLYFDEFYLTQFSSLSLRSLYLQLSLIHVHTPSLNTTVVNVIHDNRNSVNKNCA